MLVASTGRLWKVEPFLNRRFAMQEINIRLSFNETDQNWTLELNGKVYSHISTEAVDDLVDYAVVAAQQALRDQQDQIGHINHRAN
jgi:hypothetical protein